MTINLFRKMYIIRHYQPQKVVDGYASSRYTDVKMRLNVQPLNSDELQALPEGERAVKRIKVFGKDQLSASDEYTQTSGDCLFYNGRWYECVSSITWEHTPLSHYRSEFVILPQNEQEEGSEPMETAEIGDCI